MGVYRDNGKENGSYCLGNTHPQSDLSRFLGNRTSYTHKPKNQSWENLSNENLKSAKWFA